jgi:EF hand
VPRPWRSENVSVEVFQVADKNGDGKLSLQEVLNARFIDFERADVNRDGVLTFEEVDVYTRSAR